MSIRIQSVPARMNTSNELPLLRLQSNLLGIYPNTISRKNPTSSKRRSWGAILLTRRDKKYCNVYLFFLPILSLYTRPSFKTIPCINSDKCLDRLQDHCPSHQHVFGLVPCREVWSSYSFCPTPRMTSGAMSVSILPRVFKLFKLVNPESCSRVESKDKRTLPDTEKGIGEMREPGDGGQR